MSAVMAGSAGELTATDPDPREPVIRLLRDLRSGEQGISGREAARRLERYGPNELSVTDHRSWVRALARQFTQPLAVLLLLAAVLAVVAGTAELAWAIVAVVAAERGRSRSSQEHQAGRAVEALAATCPRTPACAATVRCARCPRPSWCRATCWCWPRATGSPPTPGCSTARWRSTCRR